MPLKVSSIVTKQGQTLNLGRFNVLVGANNCGKSQTLRDIRGYVTSGSTEKLVIIGQVNIELPDKAAGTRRLRVSSHESPGHITIKGVTPNLQSSDEWAPPSTWIDETFSKPAERRQQLLTHLGKYWVAHLDAESRLRLASPTECYDTRAEAPGNAMQEFFANLEAAQPELRKAFGQAFGIDIGLDWAGMKHWYLRVGNNFGDIPNDRDALNEVMAPAASLDKQGDGFRSFAGVVLGMLTFPDRLMLLDEPEAFLHPAQARVLGRWLARQAAAINAQVIVATHNADFLAGIISADVDATIVRLNRIQEGTSYHLIPPETTKGLVHSPLLSSQPVLDSLVRKGVAICEGDPDIALYQAVMHSAFGDSGGEEILFIHTNGKDAARIPAELLIKAGIPVCAIVDIDVLNSSEVLKLLAEIFHGNLWSDIAKMRDEVAASVENSPEQDLLNELISDLKKWLSEPKADLRRARRDIQSFARKGSRWEAVKQHGLDYFQGEPRKLAEQVLDKCADAGIFVVPVGSLESWIPLEVKKGKKWNRVALEHVRAGKAPEALKAFISDILHFLSR